MLELVEPLLQTDLLHLQQGAILDFIQREAVLLSKVTDQRVLQESRFSGGLELGFLPMPGLLHAPNPTICLRVSNFPSPSLIGSTTPEQILHDWLLGHISQRRLPPNLSSGYLESLLDTQFLLPSSHNPHHYPPVSRC